MKVLFISPFTYTVFPFQIASLSAFLKKYGHQTFYLELILEEEIEKKHQHQILKVIKKFKPDLIAFSSFQQSFDWIKELSTYIKSGFKIPIIVGGYHASLNPEEVISHPAIDIICRGEGEYPLLELMNSLKKKKPKYDIKNLWFKKGKKIIRNEIRPLIENLDSLPFMDREMYDYQKQLDLGGNKRRLAVMGSRGCPFNCSNCSNHALKNLYVNKNRYVRLRSIDKIIEEIKLCQKKFSFEEVAFEDDTFTLYEQWLREFCKKYKKRVGLPFTCNARPETASLKNMRLLKEAGCSYVAIGLESGDERIRRQVLKRNIPDKMLKAAFKNIKKAGLKVKSFNMVGLPYETRLSLLKTIWANLIVAPHRVQTAIYYPFKGTSLGDLCYKKKWVNLERAERLKVFSGDTALDHPHLSRLEIRLAKWLNSATALRSGNMEIAKEAFKMFSRKIFSSAQNHPHSTTKRF